jgi:hypothetical protein
VEPTDTQIRRLAHACRDRLGSPHRLPVPEGYPESLALCIIDAIQSAGPAGASAGKVVARYRRVRLAHGGDPETDGGVALLGTFHDAGSAEEWGRTIGTGDRTSGEPDAPRKAHAVEAAATTLTDLEIYSAADLREVTRLTDGFHDMVREAWAAVPGQRSGLTWRSLLTLAGVPGVKPDRIITRFVAGALGVDPSGLEPEHAASALDRAAGMLSVTPAALDHAAWRWQRAH